MGDAAPAELVPNGARAALLCRYHGLNSGAAPETLAYTRRVRNRRRLERMIGELNALKPLGPGPVACPADFGAKVLASFRYRKAPDREVTLELSGCRLVSDGQITRSALRRPGPALVRRIERLTHCREKPVCRR